MNQDLEIKDNGRLRYLENRNILLFCAIIFLEDDIMKDKKSLIIYFSRADENYSVGYIDKGNT